MTDTPSILLENQKLPQKSSFPLPSLTEKSEWSLQKCIPGVRNSPKRVFICCSRRFVVALVSFGMFIFISQLVGDLYINYVVMEILTIVRIPVTWILYLK